jgi:hypothetical protein
MSDRLQPGPGAKTRIQALSQKQFQAFFDEVPAAAMQRVARYLPSIDGFRKTSQAGILRQKEALARRLSKSIAQDRDYHGLYLIWRTWIDENVTNAVLIQELIDDVEEAAEGKDGPEARRLAVEEHVDSLLEKLKEESQQNRCTREQIERLFIFSPFPETPTARGIISAAKSAADVDRDATLSDLPTRLKQDEDEIQSIKSRLNELDERFVRVASDVEKALEELPKLQSALTEATTAAEGARNAVLQQAQAAVAAPPAQSDGALSAIEARLKALADEVEGLRGGLSDATSMLGTLSEMQQAVAQLGAVQKTYSEERQQQAERVGAIVSTFEEIKRDVTALLDDRTGADQLAPLTKQLLELERRLDVVISRPPPHYETKDLASYRGDTARDTRVGIRWDALHPTDHGAAASIQSHSGLASALAKTLQALGLRKTAAQVFGEECAAAVAGRQAVFLRGAFATRVARALARAIGGTVSARLSVPIGIQDGEELRLSIDSALGTNTASIGAVAIEGINMTALDVTQGVLADCVDPETGASEAEVARVAIFATIAQGLASLPLEAGYFELGPVFDLDYLDWRTSPSTNPELAAGILSAEVDQAIFGQLTSAAVDIEEATRLARSFTKKRNPSAERTIVRAYRALSLIRSEPQAVTPLQSLYFGWLLPRWRALRLPKDQIDSELDGGKANGQSVDPRLSAMLEAEFPDSREGDGAT